MPIEIDIAHVARLARLGLDDDELEEYGEQLGAILQHAALVQSVETEESGEGAHPLGLVNAFRPDKVTSSLDRNDVLAQAPAIEDGYFVAPPAMDFE